MIVVIATLLYCLLKFFLSFKKNSLFPVWKRPLKSLGRYGITFLRSPTVFPLLIQESTYSWRNLSHALCAFVCVCFTHRMQVRNTDYTNWISKSLKFSWLMKSRVHLNQFLKRDHNRAVFILLKLKNLRIRN